MIKSACQYMKISAVSSVAFFIAGVVLVILAQQVSLHSALPATLIGLGFVSIVVGALVMAVTVVAIMLPKVSRRLDLCQH